MVINNRSNHCEPGGGLLRVYTYRQTHTDKQKEDQQRQMRDQRKGDKSCSCKTCCWYANVHIACGDEAQFACEHADTDCIL